MRKAAGLALVIAAGLVAPAVAPAVGVPSGNVNGEAEQPRVNDLAAIRALEQEALALAGGQNPDAPLPSDIGSMVTTKLNQALDGLAALKLAIESGGPYQESTAADEAIKQLEKAEKSDVLGRTKVEKNKPASKVVHDIERSEAFKTQAGLALMGLRSTPKDVAVLKESGIPQDAVPHTADLSANKDDVKLSKPDIESGRGDALRGRGRVRRQKAPKWYPGSYLSAEALAGPPPNNYYAFEGTSSDTGYMFKSFGRRLWGPFETRFQVGAFDPDSTVDTGSACIEFDVEGSSPLQFVAVCGRRFQGGVQVFVQSHNGAAGNLYFDGAMTATVLVNYSGTQFVVKAASGIGAPDFALSTVATVNLTQGETALVAGMGASGLTKGAEIGLDEILITAK